MPPRRTSPPKTRKNISHEPNIRADDPHLDKGGGRGGAGGPSLARTATVVTVRVPRFLKHPSGHTVYACCVEMPHTRQLWVVFKRYREFVALRQLLKTSCQQKKNPASSSSGRSRSPSQTKRPFAAASGLGKGFAAGGGSGGGGGGGGGESRTGSGNVVTSRASAERIEKILSTFRFPHKLAIGRSVALREERRKALNAFLVALVKLTPLPQAAATFLGLLDDNRMGLDPRGNYVRVMHAENVLPIPTSPGYARAPGNRKALRDSRQSATVPAATTVSAAATSFGRSDLPAATVTTYQVDRDGRSEGPRPEGGGGSGGGGGETSIPTSPRGEQSGGNVNRGRGRDRGGVAVSPPPPLPPPTTGDTVAVRAEAISGARRQQHRPPVQSTLGSRTGAHAMGGGERLGEGIWDGEEGQSDTDILTDPESGSDSDSDDGETESARPNSGGTEFGRNRHGQTGSSASVAPTAAAAADNDNDDANGCDKEKRDGLLEPSRTGNATDEAAAKSDGLSSPRSGLGSGALSRDLITSSPSPSMVLLKGGGGGSSSDGSAEAKGGGEGDAFGEGWSMVGSDDEQASRGGEQEQDRGTDEEERARTIQLEFVNGYLDEVVAKVVGRQDLVTGMSGNGGFGIGGGGGGSGPRGSTYGAGGDDMEVDGCEDAEDALHACFLLSREERDVRMAELQSLGVDLPNDTLVTLLRYKDWGPEAATALYQDLVAAGKGLLEKVTPGAAIRGMENGGNTCYIDSLLFSMFATLDAFDWLLFKPLPETDPPQVKVLQKHLRFLVNQLRRGAIIPREHTNLIRTHLRTCGWQGGTSTQEDVTELFTFLVCLLRCPALPLSEALFHGGTSDASDSRISTERALYLALPQERKPDRPLAGKSLSPVRGPSAMFGDGAAAATTTTAARPSSATPSSSSASSSAVPRQSNDRARAAAAAATAGGGDKWGGAGEGGGAGAYASGAVTLEQILMHNFHDNRVEGLRRSVSGEKGIQPVDAWRMVSMLPFYSLSGELDGDADPTNDRHFDTIMLPMVLKRYETEEVTPSASPSSGGGGGGGGGGGWSPGQAKKSSRKVIVPHRLDVSNFMAPSAGAKEGGAAEPGRFVLVLRSAVCHIGGESVNKGHYVSYTADRVTSEGGAGGGDAAAAAASGLGRPQPTAEKSAGNIGAGGSAASGRLAGSADEHADGHDSVAWLRLDDLKKGRAGQGFVERLDSVHDADRLFSEDLGLHSYMLFYELVPLNLDDADKAQMKEKYALIETQPDYELALQLELIERTSSSSLLHSKRAGKGGSTANNCFVS